MNQENTLSFFLSFFCSFFFSLSFSFFLSLFLSLVLSFLFCDCFSVSQPPLFAKIADQCRGTVAFNWTPDVRLFAAFT